MLDTRRNEGTERPRFLPSPRLQSDMDAELRRYLRAIVALLSLIIGFQATDLLVSGVSMSATFFVVPGIGGALVGAVVWFLTGTLER